MKKICCFMVAFNLYIQWAVAQTDAGEAIRTDLSAVSLYDADPGNLWNRLYAALFQRVDAVGNAYGPDSLDILFWTDTKHLLAEPSHGAAIKVLDEFIASHGEKLIESPLKRAVMQHDLWAAYDWTVRRGNIKYEAHSLATTLGELQSRLAVVIKRIALSRKQIEGLPDNYAGAVASGKFAPEPDPAHPGEPFLPPALFQPESPWACLGSSIEVPPAVEHERGCSGRSAFLVFVRLPEGRAALSAYLNLIKKFTAYVPDPDPPKNRIMVKDEPMKRNPAMPQIPAGTMVALVRQMVLIDNKGRPVATHLTESVQLRIYRRIVEDNSNSNEEHAQSFYEFLPNRKQLFANLNGGLRAAGKDDREFGFGPQTELPDGDPFDSANPIRNYPQTTTNCFMCHREPGVFSINSVSERFEMHRMHQRSLYISTPQLEKEKAVKRKENFQMEGLQSRYP